MGEGAAAEVLVGGEEGAVVLDPWLAVFGDYIVRIETCQPPLILRFERYACITRWLK